MAYQLLNFRNPTTGFPLPLAYLRAGRISLDKDNLAANVVLKIYANAGEFVANLPPVETLALNLTGASYTSTFQVEGSTSVKNDDAIIANVYSDLPTNPQTSTLLAGSTVVP